MFHVQIIDQGDFGRVVEEFLMADEWEARKAGDRAECDWTARNGPYYAHTVNHLEVRA